MKASTSTRREPLGSAVVSEAPRNRRVLAVLYGFAQGRRGGVLLHRHRLGEIAWLIDVGPMMTAV